MGLHFVLRIIGLAILLGSGIASAQDTEIEDSTEPIGPAKETVVETMAAPPAATEWPDAVLDALASWQRSWEEKPDLVTLKDDLGPILETPDDIRQRLKLLGTKVLSNREWSDYWATQAVDSEALMNALRTAGIASDRIQGLETWAGMAEKKVKNQEAYLDAIRLERESQEAHLETMLDAEDETEDISFSPEDPNPYEQRSLLLAELDKQIAIQTEKQSHALERINYIDQQLTGEAQLVQALVADEELALAEARIAQKQATLDLNDPLNAIWNAIASASAEKVAQIAGESRYYKKRERTRKVELELTQSEVDYRQRRIGEFQAEFDAESGFQTLIGAVWETFINWITHEAWRILIALLLIAIVGLLLRLGCFIMSAVVPPGPITQRAPFEKNTI